MKFFAALLLAALSLTAAETQARTITDAAGRKVEIPDTVKRVLAAGPPASVLVYVLAPDKLTGWVRQPGDAEKQFLMPSVRDLPTFGQLTGKGGTANMEAVLAAKPDIIIDVGTVNPTYTSLADKVQAQTGIPYVLIDGSFARSAETLREAGDIIGTGDRAEKLAAYAAAKISDLSAKLASIPESDRPRVYYGRGPEGLETGLSGSINLEILGAVGATNVAAAASKGGLTQVSLEQILSWRPDTILAASGKFAASVKSDPLWKDLDAVKNNRVFVTPNLPFGWFDSPPGINRLIGISWLEHLFYPKQFTGDLKADVREFFTLFYQVDLTDDQLAMLLKGSGAQSK
ncbi:iron ABC transporter substrate-binding protein [Rhizobium sp. BG4]|uniref:iron ABC transporter substrate-binding protein n=1 Tax=Rhizobium sp. BG4 TaxID=2613770 RepID=UPI00193CB81B|nr:iron ABC transporter substrate-binding protein [Rhizobium sp. BG4]QRM44921.1 iron ABC transporter substrate-binding protein [Rhizobium sp. BG4]